MRRKIFLLIYVFIEGIKEYINCRANINISIHDGLRNSINIKMALVQKPYKIVCSVFSTSTFFVTLEITSIVFSQENIT